MTQKTERFIQTINAQTMFDEIVDDIRAAHIPKPRIHVVTHFSSIGTTLVVFDRFCGVLEVNKESVLNYVALGRAEGDTLSTGMLELVDHRMIDDDEAFKKGTDAFIKLIGDNETKFIRDIPSITDREEIIETILDCWKFGGEVEMWGGFH